MKIQHSRAKKKQSLSRHWSDLARWALERYNEDRSISSLNLYHEAQGKAAHFYAGARFLMGIENARYTEIHMSDDRGLACNIDRNLDGRPIK